MYSTLNRIHQNRKYEYIFFCTTLPSTFPGELCILIPRRFLYSLLSSFLLQMGTTQALYQSSGTLPFMYALANHVIHSATTFLSAFNIYSLTSSISGDFPLFKSFKCISYLLHSHICESDTLLLSLTSMPNVDISSILSSTFNNCSKYSVHLLCTFPSSTRIAYFPSHFFHHTSTSFSLHSTPSTTISYSPCCAPTPSNPILHLLLHSPYHILLLIFPCTSL